MPEAGLCAMEAHPNYDINARDVLVFDLLADPTERSPIKDEQVIARLTEQLHSWKATIVESAVNESQCMAPGSLNEGEYKSI